MDRGPCAWILLAALTVPLAGGVFAATPERVEGLRLEELFPGARFDPAVPTQESLFGVLPGGRPLRHAELLEYFRALARSSPRARLDVYSHSHEGRELVVLAVGDEATIADLDGFRERHARLTDPRGRPAGEDAGLVEEAKAVAWMAYAIHGDELSSADAAAALAYRLVAGEDEAARALRRELVVFIDPCENPDGRARFLAQTRSFAHRVPNPDTEDLSHGTVWPWGRGNHYLFDLNRDWFSMVQPESRRSGRIAAWAPQLMVDSHEMGAHDTYLFPPPRHPFNPWLPAYEETWLGRFSADQARALDRYGYPYYTREWNEEFFPGYGSSWATYLGAVGILYEMSETTGTLVHKRDGSVRTYPQAVRHQVVSSLANLTTLAENRRQVLADFVAGRREAIARAGRDWPAAWVLPANRHPDRVERLVGLLVAQGIEVERVEPSGLRGLRDARSGEPVDPGELPGRVWAVRLDQPAGPLVRELLDPHVPMRAAFFREEREYLERGRGTRLYEVTAWSLPLAYDVNAYWTGTLPPRGEPVAELPVVAGGVEEAEAAVAWSIGSDTDRSMAALADLLQRGVAVRVADKPFDVAGRELPRGSLVVRREGNPEDLVEQLSAVARDTGVKVWALPTSRAAEGPDLGGRHYRPLTPPRVGIWAGWPVSPSAYGALWHLLDEEIGLRFNGLDLGRFGGTDLSRYNVLVFPPARRPGYRSVLGESGVAALRRWIEGGGTAIGIGGGAAFLADAETGLTRTRLRRQALERYPPVVLGPGPEQAEAAGPFRAAGLRAPEERKEGKEAAPEKARSRAQHARPAGPGSPYDVAPVLGEGARPFAEGFEQGTAAVAAPVDLARWLEPFLPPGRSEPEPEDLERADERLRRFSPRGAFLRVELDPERWLAWGLGTEVPALVEAHDALVAEPPVEVAARFAGAERLHLGGLLWPEAAGRLAHTAYATREASGRGQVILFLDEPEFRGWTLGTRRMLANALLLGPGLGTRWPDPW